MISSMDEHLDGGPPKAYCWGDVPSALNPVIARRCPNEVPPATTHPEHVGLCPEHLERYRSDDAEGNQDNDEDEQNE